MGRTGARVFPSVFLLLCKEEGREREGLGEGKERADSVAPAVQLGGHPVSHPALSRPRHCNTGECLVQVLAPVSQTLWVRLKPALCWPWVGAASLGLVALPGLAFWAEEDGRWAPGRAVEQLLQGL